MKSLLVALLLSLAPSVCSFRHGNSPILFGNLTARTTIPNFRRPLTLQQQQPNSHGIPHCEVSSPSRRRLRRTLPASRTKATRPAATILRGGAVLLTTTPPAVTTWLPPALLCALAYALYNLFLKQASSSIDPVLGGVLLQIVAAGLGAALLGFQQATKGAQPLQYNQLGVAWAVAAGAAVGLAEILSFVISGMGVPASKSIPTIIGGSVLMGTILGAVWLGEKLTLRGWFGTALIAIGIALVGMDPGSSLH